MVAMLSASCGVYHPQMAEIPLIDHKGDVHLSAKIGSPSTFTVTMSAGVTDHIAVQMYADNSPMASSNYSHFEVGYYGVSGRSVYELYAGLGYGTSRIHDVDHVWYTSGKYFIPYIQVNWGLKNLSKAHVDLGVSLKTGCIVPEFHIINTISSTYSWDIKTGYLIEPQTFVRFGGERVKFCLQAGYCFTDIFQTSQTHHVPYAVGMGVTFFVKPKYL